MLTLFAVLIHFGGLYHKHPALQLAQYASPDSTYVRLICRIGGAYLHHVDEIHIQHLMHITLRGSGHASAE